MRHTHHETPARAEHHVYPVPVVLVTCGGDRPNVFTLNRISSCNAEPPMLAISVRPMRYSHDLIHEQGEFVVNIPTPGMELISEYVGVVTGREEDKWAVTGLTPVPASVVKRSLIAECPVNVECRVVHEIRLPSHSLFIGEVVAIHAEEAILNARGEVDWAHTQPFAYAAGVARERPIRNVKVDELREHVRALRAKR